MVSNSALGVLLQVGTGSVFGFGGEGRGVLLNRVVQRGLFQAVVLVVNGGAARRPLGPPANGVNARLPKWRVCTVSKPALLLNRLECHRPVCVLCAGGGPPSGAGVQVRIAALGRRKAGWVVVVLRGAVAVALALAMPVSSWRTIETSMPPLVLHPGNSFAALPNRV